ncbi:MAG: HIT family protein [Candidatus Pacebacteria bacterium]|nr:HIT family protein [Candidatus Paceibacterota bacterium]
MSTIFTKIINREIPAHFIYEDDICIVIMDKFPVIQGQVLVISKACNDYLFDLDDETYKHLLAVARRISKALDITYNSLRTCLLIEGFEVPHAHIKLYPVIRREFHIHGGKEVDDAKLEAEAQKIRANLS